MFAIGEWLGTEHLIQDKVMLKPMVVVGGDGEDAEGKLLQLYI